MRIYKCSGTNVSVRLRMPTSSRRDFGRSPTYVGVEGVGTGRQSIRRCREPRLDLCLVTAALHLNLLPGIYEEVVMKSVVIAVAAASALSLPLAAFSQTDPALTRAQVRAELQQLEQVGYDPAKSADASYPGDIQAAEARVSTDHATEYGGMPSGSSTSGSRTVVRPASDEDMKHLYSGGQ